MRRPPGRMVSCIPQENKYLDVSEILQHEIRHHSLHVVKLVGILDLVFGLRIEHGLEVLTGFLKFMNKLHGMFDVDVVVHCAMKDQEFAMEFVGGLKHGAVSIPLRIV